LESSVTAAAKREAIKIEKEKEAIRLKQARAKEE